MQNRDEEHAKVTELMQVKEKLEQILDSYKNNWLTLCQEFVETAVIHDYPSLREACLHLDFFEFLLSLNPLIEIEVLSIEDLRKKFKEIAAQRRNLTKETMLSPFATPSFIANKCFDKIFTLLYGEQINLIHYLQVFMPEVEIVLELEAKLDFTLLTSNYQPLHLYITENKLSEKSDLLEGVNLSEVIVAGNILLSVPSFIGDEFVQHPRLFQQTYFLLSEKYPAIYKKLIAHNSQIGNLYANIANSRTPLRTAINDLITELRQSGERKTGQAFATKRAEKAISTFQIYLDTLPKDLKKQAENLSTAEGRFSLKWVIEDYLVQYGECVETGADYLEEILMNKVNHETLNLIPEQYQSSIKTSKLTTQKIKTNGKDYTDALPEQYVNILADKINLPDTNAYALGEFLSRFDKNFYPIFLKKEHFINQIKTIQDLVILIIFLDLPQLSCALQLLKSKLFALIKTNYDFKVVLELLSPEQRAIVFEQMKEKLSEMIKTSSDFRFILPFFSTAQCATACLILKDELPHILPHAEDFILILLSASKEQCATICMTIVLQDKLFEAIQLNSNFVSVILSLPQEKGIILCQALEEKLPEMINSQTELAIILQFFLPCQLIIVLNAIKKNLSKMISAMINCDGFTYKNCLLLFQCIHENHSLSAKEILEQFKIKYDKIGKINQTTFFQKSSPIHLEHNDSPELLVKKMITCCSHDKTAEKILIELLIEPLEPKGEVVDEKNLMQRV